MDSTSNIVEKVVEPNNETKDVHADVDNDKSAEKLLDSTIDTDQSVILTCNKNDDELIIDESASKECKSEENITSGEAVYSAPSAATIIDKGLIPTGSFEDNTNDGINGSSYIESENQTVEDLSMKPSLSIIQENSLANIKINSINTDSEATPKDNIIDDTNIVSASNDEEVPAQEDEGEHVRSIEDGKLHDCSESLTEKNPNEPTTISPDLFSECTKSEIVTSTNPVNKLEELSENVKCKNEELFHKLLEESTNQSNNFNSQIRESGRVGLSDQNEFNNQILEIISDIDINIKAQEKITQLKEQELKLIQKQNDLANQIQQQQILAQKLSAQNQQTQYPSGKLDLLSRQQNERSISTSGLNEDAALKEATNVSKTVDLRKIFTPATDTNEILPKNRKLYASSAFYSPSLHPTVEDQVELARRISHSLSDISNQTSKGQSMYVNRKKRSDKWVHEGSSQGNECSNGAMNQYKENSERNSSLEITKLEKIPLKLIMNPNGKVRDYNSLKELINVEAGLLCPDNCAELITALHLHQGRGAELFAKRRRKADNWVVDESNLGTQNHPSGIPDHQQHQQRATISQNIFPAYSDAGKHRVQLNIHQNQLIEKYSRPGLQVVQSPWEAALETGSASSAFLEENKSQCALRTAISPIQYSQCASKDLTDSLEPFGASLEPTHFRPQKNYTNIIASPPQSFNVPSNPQRELAYTPSVAQGWGGRTVELPKDSFWQTRPQYGNADDSTHNCNYLFGDHLASDFAVNVENRLIELEKFQKYLMEQPGFKTEMLRNKENVYKHSTKLTLASQSSKDLIPKSEIDVLGRIEQKIKNDVDQTVNVRDIIQSFEVQNITESTKCRAIQATEPMNHEGLYVPKEISLSSYVAPPQQYGGYNKHFESQRSLSGSLPKSTTKLLANDDIKKSSLAPEFKIRFNTVPPTEQLHSPCSYKKKPNGVENFSPQVNFSPSPLSFNKLAMYEQPDQRNMKITSNASPTQYGITSFEHVSGSPSSIGSVESPRHMLPTGSLRCGPLTTGSDSPLSIRGQSFNKCARGWGTTPDKQERYRLPLEGNLPFSDF
ncbi:uncharacterized protein LOC108102351 isoform X3 [Drosophila eugracilis]|uniref:uncharacterized protein LOC108102351 isoform X3 n=1 Tax=Drosophila eugracilis TaxID=29029 RepID=UPI0007E77932|nr:uncharacterized protein LOC108102351 isoform X3 [Drosophila eugracilis]